MPERARLLDEPWSLRHGRRIPFTASRGDHLIHHRGQLTVYLRLVDMPLSQIYRPTADERW